MAWPLIACNAALAAIEADVYPAVGSGPYIAVEQKKDQYVKLKANPDYWLGKPKIDELQFIFYDNPQAAIAGLKKGDIDLIGRMTPPDFESIKGDPNIEQWNTQGPPRRVPGDQPRRHHHGRQARRQLAR
ncbi:ABC transporter substrate-binding protein [Nonomuraea sp. NPDC026600]|uniref:ABC transporter substrate-binding protein n=1 Tax=Nonomuraea sp. NPDC026600 TaxID=3155363 RepID=UPI0033F46041